MKKTKKKVRNLKILSFLSLIAPITAVTIYNASDYFTLEQGLVLPQRYELGIGLLLGAGAGILLVLGKMDFLKGSKGLWFLTILMLLLKALVNDIVLILFALSIGSTLYQAYQPSIIRLKTTAGYEEQADIQSKALGNVIKQQSVNTLDNFNGRS